MIGTAIGQQGTGGGGIQGVTEGIQHVGGHGQQGGQQAIFLVALNHSVKILINTF